MNWLFPNDNEMKASERDRIGQCECVVHARCTGMLSHNGETQVESRSSPMIRRCAIEAAKKCTEKNRTAYVDTHI